MGERDTMKKVKVIKIWPAPHVEVRLHVSKEMEEDYRKCCLSGGMYSCEKCSWDNVQIEGKRVCQLKCLERGIKLPLGLERE